MRLWSHRTTVSIMISQSKVKRFPTLFWIFVIFCLCFHEFLKTLEWLYIITQIIINIWTWTLLLMLIFIILVLHRAIKKLLLYNITDIILTILLWRSVNHRKVWRDKQWRFPWFLISNLYWVIKYPVQLINIFQILLLKFALVIKMAGYLILLLKSLFVFMIH